MVFDAAFVVHGELLAGVDAFGGVGGDDFVPESGGFGVGAAAFGMLRQFAAGLRADVVGQAEVEGLGAGGLGALGVSPAVKKAGEAEEIAAIDAAVLWRFRGEQ